MRKLAAALAGVAIGVLVLGFTLVTTSRDAHARPSLQLVSKSPLTLRGKHFEQGERMRLVVNGRTRTQVTASEQGDFVIIVKPGATRCDRIRVVAIGSGGSRTEVKSLPAPACLPMRTS